MFDFRYGIDQVGNVAEGATVCSYAHLKLDGEDMPPVRNTVESVMPIRLRRQHVAGGTPGVIVWRDGELRVIAIAGAREIEDQVQAIQGWSLPTTTPILPGQFNPSALTWYTSVSTFIADELAAANLPTYIYAFSWGGAAACILAKKMQMANPHQVSLCVTFGSPRFCDYAAAGQFLGVVIARIFNARDPMPLMPPPFETAPFANAAAGLATMTQWAKFRHTHNGVEMSAVGDLSAAVLPSQVPLPIDVNIYDYIRLSVGEGRAHNIVNYMTILETRYPESGDQATDPGIVISEVYQGHNLLEARGKPDPVRTIARMVRSIISSREVSSTGVPAAMARARNRRLIRIVKGATGWSVFIGQDRVYEATSKRDARGVANALRMFSVQVGQQPALFTQTDIYDILRRYQNP